jgi:nucleoside-diphosphate-sugar epimerase
MKVLVTGGSGFLGSHIVEQLVAQGHDVRALVRKSSDTKFLLSLGSVDAGGAARGNGSAKHGRVELAYGAIEDAVAVAEAVKGVDAIIHSAGLVKARSPSEFRQTNVMGTQNLIDAARKNAPDLKRFVLVSSLAAVGPSHDGKPVDGAGTPGPVTHYGRSKLDAERAVLAAKGELPVVILRPAAIYGPRDNEVFAFFQAVSRGILPTIGNGESTMSMIYGADCAEACVKALTADVPSGSTYFVDDGVAHGFRSMLEQIEEALGKKAKLRINLPFPVVYAMAFGSEMFGKLTNKAVMLNRDKMNEIRQPHWVCSSEKTQAALGWTPRTNLREGTAITAKWYRDNNWL